MGETKKTVLFIVEGISDKAALEKIFKSIYKYDRLIDFKFTDGDISSDPLMKGETAEETFQKVADRIYGIVSDFIKDRKLKKSDIYQIVQIFDMDGAYIPDEAILPGESYEFVYSEEGIKSKDTARVKERNELKRTIMDHLIGITEIKGIPYEMYFMSCNLDHALYDEINLDKDKKQEYADAFYERFIGKESKFIEFLNTDVVNGTPNTMSGSWRFIKEGTRSVERHTNLHVYFLMHPRPEGLY